MHTKQHIAELLEQLDERIADELESQHLDFKQWDLQSREKAVRTVVNMAVCMANGGGGSVVFGVADQVRGREKALVGVPLEIDSHLLKKAVYERTDPKITPVFEDIPIPHGTGRLLLMHIYPGMPPYTDTSGQGTFRSGKDCLPLTGTIRRKIAVETGETDFTARIVAPFDPDMLSPSAMESLRDLARAERAPGDLLTLSDAELLNRLDVIKNGQFTRAALLLGGTEEALRQHLPGYGWTFLQMNSDTDYGIREDRTAPIPLSIQRIEELFVPFNPITTLERGFFHLEYHTWPPLALREALMNAFCHPDLRISGPVLVKLHADRLEISNNGGFIAGITEQNILHHPPAARNPLLVEALTRMRLVNRSSLGVNRMFKALLVEGKEPPLIREIGESVQVTFFRRELSPAFRMFVAEQSKQRRDLSLESLLVLQYLLKHPEIETNLAARICQQSDDQMREHLASMERLGYIEHGGTGRGAYWTMRPELHRRLTQDDHQERTRRIDWEAAKTRVLSVLMERSKRGEPGMRNQDIRRLTHYSRHQVIKLMKELMKENKEIQEPGRGSQAAYRYVAGNNG
ncbi:ATP-binding protein [Desulfonatronum parangueonense]